MRLAATALAMDELVAQPELLGALLEHMAEGVYLVDAQRRITVFNERLLELFDLPAGLIKPGDRVERALEILYERGDFLSEAQYRRACRELQRGGAEPFRYERERANGRRVELRGSPTPGGGFVVTCSDITDRRSEAELRLRDRALGAISQGITVADAAAPDLALVYVNPAFEAMTGYEAAEVLGRGCVLLDPPADPAFVARFKETLLKGEPFRGELTAYRKDGSAFQDELSVSLVQDAAGRITHFVGVHNDITQRRQLEAQLAQAQKMEAIGQLTGGIAHDFNNLLMVVSGNLQLLEEKLLTAEPGLRGLVQTAGDAVTRGAQLTRRMLAFARSQRLEPRTIDATLLIKDLLPLIRRMLGETIAVDAKLVGDLWPTVTDPHQLESALVNLAINARDAMPRGGRLIIATEKLHLSERSPEMPELEPGDFVAISVGDSGVGMSEEVRRRAFEPFYTTKEPGKGTGLGLSMVHGFIKQCGGQISLASTPGAGTIVAMYLPRATGEALAAPAPPAPGAAPGGEERVLLVEDNAMVRQTAARILESLGYVVSEAADGASAIDKLLAEPEIEVMFTDVVMPGGMSGWDLAETAWKIRPALKVLFTTGYTDNPILQKAEVDRRLHVLQKPYRKQELARLLREVIAE